VCRRDLYPDPTTGRGGEGHLLRYLGFALLPLPFLFFLPEEIDFNFSTTFSKKSAGIFLRNINICYNPHHHDRT